MNKLLLALLALSTTFVSVKADPAVKGWKTNDSMGCMLLRECTDEVKELTSAADLEAHFPYSNFTTVRQETDGLITELRAMGVNVYLGDDKYFPPGHAGVYDTVGNRFFLNTSYADDPYGMLRTLRHEAWHAAQDAMAGTIENSNLAIIYPEEDVPQNYVLAADIAYASFPQVLPWEREAKWAGGTPNMTLEVLRIINATNNRPWQRIEPTPLTREWLEMKGYM